MVGSAAASAEPFLIASMGSFERYFSPKREMRPTEKLETRKRMIRRNTPRMMWTERFFMVESILFVVF